MTSAFKPFDQAAPSIVSGAEPQNIEATRTNLLAIIASMVASGTPMPGWNYTNSFTRGEAAPGTAALPARDYYTLAIATPAIWVKRVLTYTGTDLTKIAYYWSEDGEQSYDTLRDTSGNYVLTQTFDGAHNKTAATWGQTP